jgi:hypothetical protein
MSRPVHHREYDDVRPLDNEVDSKRESGDKRAAYAPSNQWVAKGRGCDRPESGEDRIKKLCPEALGSL